MAALTTAAWIAISSLLATGGQMIDANQQRQKAKGELGKLDAITPPVAPVAALAPAPTTKKPKATGTAGARGGTLLTGPQGVVTPAPVVRKTLLGM